MPQGNPYPGPDIVGFVKHHLPDAIEWAEAERRSTRVARLYNVERTVARGVCALGHPIPGLKLGPDALATRPADPSCGYCQTAIEHSRMWVPPDPASLVAVEPCPECRPLIRCRLHTLP